MQFNNLLASVFKILFIIWTVFIFCNYIIHHPINIYALTKVPYLATILCLALFSGAAYYILHKVKPTLRGWIIYALILVFMLIIYNGFAIKKSLYTDSVLSHQIFFLVKNIGFHMASLLIFSLTYLTGQAILGRFKINLNQHYFQIISTATGIGVISLILMGLAAFNVLYSWVVLPLIGIFILWRWKHLISFFKYIFWQPFPKSFLKIQAFLPFVLILIFIAFYLIGSVKLYPLGFDGSLLYQNITNSLFSSHGLVNSGQAYNWSLFTSLGPLLFGQISFSIILSHTASILCIWALYHLGRLFLNNEITLLALSLFVTTSSFAFHCFLDEKVDLAFLFISVSVIILTLIHIKNYEIKKPEIAFNTLVLIGFLLGISMGIKYLGILLFVGILCLFIYKQYGYKLFLASFLLILSIFFALRVDSFGYLEISNSQRYAFVILTFITALLLLLKERKSILIGNYKNLLKSILIVSLGFVCSFGPWMIKHAIQSDKFEMKSLLYGNEGEEWIKIDFRWLVKNQIPISIGYERRQLINSMMDPSDRIAEMSDIELIEHLQTIKSPEFLKERKKFIESQKGDGKKEELQRYLGYEKGLARYISLPYDLTMNTNIPNNRGLDIGFLFLVFLPLFFISFKKSKEALLKNSFVSVFFGLIFLFGWKATLHNGAKSITPQEHLNKYLFGSNDFLRSIADSFFIKFLNFQDSLSTVVEPLYKVTEHWGIHIILFSLILITILLSLFTKVYVQKFPFALKSFCILIFSYGFLWWILGNGVTYYAMLIWALLSLLLCYLIQNIKTIFPISVQNFIRTSFLSMAGLFLFFNLLVLFTNNANNWKHLEDLYYVPFVQYSSSNISSSKALKSSIPLIKDVKDLLNKNPNDRIYKVGTYLNFHIDNNIDRVFSDNQLIKFNKIRRGLSNEMDFIKILKLKGVKFILFDLNVASIDKTPDQSLVKKANNLVRILNNGQLVKLALTDKVITRINPTTNRAENTYGLAGKTVQPGTFAIFEIL